MIERWTAGAAQDYPWFRERDPKIAQRIDRLIEAIKRRPFAGIGKPEPLRGILTGWWSRRITGEHRLVYRVVGRGPHASCRSRSAATTTDATPVVLSANDVFPCRTRALWAEHRLGESREGVLGLAPTVPREDDDPVDAGLGVAGDVVAAEHRPMAHRDLEGRLLAPRLDAERS